MSPWIWRSESVRKLRKCKSQKEESEAFDFTKEAVDLITKNVTKLPCTKVTYHMGKDGPYAKGNDKIMFHVTMQSPYEIEVNEEVFMLDLVGVIGSIGGTLGLCIGFSFK